MLTNRICIAGVDGETFIQCTNVDLLFFIEASECDAVHVVMDRHVITGQNDQSTLCAVQNLILLCNAR